MCRRTREFSKAHEFTETSRVRGLAPLKVVIPLSAVLLVVFAIVVTGSIMQNFVEPPLRNWGIMLKAYSPILFLSGMILVLSTRIRGKNAFPLRFFLEWFTPLGSYLGLISFLTSTFDAYALGLNVRELDLYEVLLREVMGWSQLQMRSASYIELSVLLPVSAGIALGILCVLCVTKVSLQTRRASSPRPSALARWFRQPASAKILGKLAISGRVVSHGVLIGITIVSLLGLPGASMVFMGHPFQELFDRLIGSNLRDVSFLAGYMFAYGPSIAFAFCAIEIFQDKIGKTLCGISVIIALPILFYWMTLPAKLLVSLIAYQLFAFPGFAICSLIFASILVLLTKMNKSQFQLSHHKVNSISKVKSSQG
jgi:hypothetical protein